jgi:hypothetical protein
MGLALLTASSAFADVSYTGGTYSQNFDTLASGGTNNPWTNNSTIAGWYLYQQAASGTAITTYNAGTGSSNAGAFYSFGAAGSSERSLGGVASGGSYFGSPATGAIAGWIAVGIQNDTGLSIDSFTISFDGEQWRDGGTNPAGGIPTAQTMRLEYGFGSSFTSVASWVSPGGNFDWASPVFVNTTTSGAAVNGNSAGLVASRGGTITGLNWMSGDKLFIRWIERNDVNSDHGLAVDNFNFSATAVPEPTSAGLLALTGVAGLAFRRRRS